VSLIIVDNSGNLEPDDLPRQLSVNILKPSKNIGYAGACYLGASNLVDADLLMFSNNDVIFTSDSLLYLVKAAASLPKAGALQPLVLRFSSSNKPTVDSVGLTSNPIMHGFNYCNWPVQPLKRLSLSGSIRALEVFGVDGMCFLVNGKVWRDIDGWDPDFFMFNEDALLSWKLRLGGYRNYVILNAVVYHMRGGTAKGYFTKLNPIFPSYYTSRNKILSMLYLYKSTWLIKYLPMGLLIELAKNTLLSVQRRNSLHIWFYIKALKYIFSNSRKIRYERGKVKRLMDEDYLLNNGLILPLGFSLALLISRMISYGHNLLK